MRVLLEGSRMALDAIWVNKLRSILTLLANVVAVTAVIGVVSILTGMDAYMRDRVFDEGSGVFSVSRVDQLKILSSLDEFMRSLRNPNLTMEDVEYLRSRLELAELVGASVGRSSGMSAGSRSLDRVRVTGRTEEYAFLRELELEEGRHIAPFEMRRSVPVAVIGLDVAESLFPHVSPIGRRIRIGNRHARVVGVLASQGAVFGQSQDVFAIVPIGFYQKIFSARQSVDVQIKVRDMDRLDDALAEARFFMRIRHGLRPSDPDDFGVVTSELLVELWTKLSRTLFLALCGIVSISLVIGGIIIMNIMLVSVNERTREIGVRKALGATRRALLWQFLVESVTFSTLGGVIGIVLGFALAALVARFTPLPYAVRFWAILLALGVTGATGVFFGIYPASRAAALDPIEALRYE